VFACPAVKRKPVISVRAAIAVMYFSFFIN
jgi:hypothetical protein